MLDFNLLSFCTAIARNGVKPTLAQAGHDLLVLTCKAGQQLRRPLRAQCKEGSR